MAQPKPPPDWQPIQPAPGTVPLMEYEWDAQSGKVRRTTNIKVQIKPPERPL